MMKMVSSIIVFVLIFAVVLFLFYPVGQSNEIPGSFGTWKLNVYGIDMDGNEIPFEIRTNNAQLLSFSYMGSTISSIKYKLSAKASGNGFSICEIDLTDVKSDAAIFAKNGGPGSFSYFWSDLSGSTCTIDLDNSYHTLIERSYALNSANDAPQGEYTFEMRFNGDAKFRGKGGTTGEWMTEPIDFNAMVTLTSDGGSSDDGGSGGGSGGSDIEYKITISTFPQTDWVEVSKPNSNVYERKYGAGNTIYTFHRVPGQYTVRAFFPSLGTGDGWIRDRDFSVSSKDISLVLNGYVMQIGSLMFNVEASNTVNEYDLGNGYSLGG